MEVYDLITFLYKNGIRLKLEGNNLKVKGKRGALTPYFKNLIHKNKDDLITVLKNMSMGRNKEKHHIKLPSTFLESKILVIFKSILNIRNICVERDFNDYLIHNDAIKIIQAIKRKLGILFPDQMFFDNPTIRSFSEKINMSESFKGNFILKMFHSSNKLPIAYLSENEMPPLFFACPLGGILPGSPIVGLLELDSYIKEVASFYILISDGLLPEHANSCGKPEGIDRENFFFDVGLIHKKAESLAYNIIKHHNQSLYKLGGFCSGSILILEVAKILISLGKTIEKLILIDPPIWVADTNVKISYKLNYKDVANYIVNDLGWDIEGLSVEELSLLLGQSKEEFMWDTCYKYTLDKQMFSHQYSAEDLMKAYQIKFYNDKILKDYFAQNPYNFPYLNIKNTYIFSTKDTQKVIEASVKNTISGRINIKLLPGLHHNLFLPHYLNFWGKDLAKACI